MWESRTDFYRIKYLHFSNSKLIEMMHSVPKLNSLSKKCVYNNVLCRRWLFGSLVSYGRHTPTELLLDGEHAYFSCALSLSKKRWPQWLTLKLTLIVLTLLISQTLNVDHVSYRGTGNSLCLALRKSYNTFCLHCW